MVSGIAQLTLQVIQRSTDSLAVKHEFLTACHPAGNTNAGHGQFAIPGVGGSV
jgi:hypothetical protein